MGTTTKMAIPYPEATGLVKDGWEDMKDIATQVDAKSGLILINKTTFTAVTSFSVDNLFSANYANYRVILKIDTSSTSTDNLLMRLRTATSPADITAANYAYAHNAPTTAAANATVGATGQTTSLNLSNSDIKAVFDFHNPFDATINTSFEYVGSSSNTTYAGGGQYQATTSVGGLTFYTAGTSNLTGLLYTYGYNE